MTTVEIRKPNSVNRRVMTLHASVRLTVHHDSATGQHVLTATDLQAGHDVVRPFPSASLALAELDALTVAMQRGVRFQQLAQMYAA